MVKNRSRFMAFCIAETNYLDPLGPQAQRPKTAAPQRGANVMDAFDDEELGDDMLPE
jgi:intraflagellar transport protein 88